MGINIGQIVPLNVDEMEPNFKKIILDLLL